MSLQTIECPRCGDSMNSRTGKPTPTSSYDDYLRECEKCEIAFSNNKSNHTMIFKDYLNNIPELLHKNIDRSLANSFNIRNCINKSKKIAFSTSEDALTWSFFNYFVVNKRLKEPLEILNIESLEADYEIYLWGVNITSELLNTDLFQKLIEVSDFFKENVMSRSETDVIIKLKNKLVFIEVKYRSSNDVKKGIDKFKKYLIPHLDNKIISNNGHYELFRNWAFAKQLSKGGDFEIINLGFNNLFKGQKLIALQEFENIIKTENGRFVKLTWREIIYKVNNRNLDSWFKDYLHKKLTTKI